MRNFSAIRESIRPKVASFIRGMRPFFVILLVGALLGIVFKVFDLHFAFYREDAPGRWFSFKMEIGDPSTSLLKESSNGK